MNTRRGFSLVELLIILAILGVLLSIATPNYLGWRADAQVQEAAVRFARDLDAARTLAKRTNVARTVSAAAGSDSYTVAGTTTSLGPSARFAGVSGTTTSTFLPPYGTKETAVDTYRIVHRSAANAARTIRVVGVTGQVVIRRD